MTATKPLKHPPAVCPSIHSLLSHPPPMHAVFDLVMLPQGACIGGSRTSHPDATHPPLLIQAIFVQATFIQGHNRLGQFCPGS